VVREQGFFADKIILALLIFSIIAISLMPLINAIVTVQATVGNRAPDITRIRICTGSCDLNVAISPGSAFTIEVNATDPNGWGDINTESFRIELYTATDLNGAAESWDHNTMLLNYLPDRLVLGTANGCTQTPLTGIYCITVQSTSWSVKFLSGDANIYVSVDDNTKTEDYNFLPRGSMGVNIQLGTSEDTTAGTYSGNPGDTDQNFLSTQTAFRYIRTTHNGNVTLDLNVVGQHFVVTGATNTGATIKDGNQTWRRAGPDNNLAVGSTAFVAGAQTIVDDFLTRGTSPDSNTMAVYYWLDIPAAQLPAVYDSNLTYGSKKSTN